MTSARYAELPNVSKFFWSSVKDASSDFFFILTSDTFSSLLNTPFQKRPTPKISTTYSASALCLRQ